MAEMNSLKLHLMHMFDPWSGGPHVHFIYALRSSWFPSDATRHATQHEIKIKEGT